MDTVLQLIGKEGLFFHIQYIAAFGIWMMIFVLSLVEWTWSLFETFVGALLFRCLLFKHCSRRLDNVKVNPLVETTILHPKNNLV